MKRTKSSTQRRNGQNSAGETIGFFSQRLCMSLNGQYVHNPGLAYSIFCFLLDGDIVRNAGFLWLIYIQRQ